MGGSLSTILCTLTLIPYRNNQWPRPTETLHLNSLIRIDWDSNFSKNAPFLDDNLCISYQGKQCMGTSVKVYSDSKFKGTRYEAILEHDSGTVCLPCEVKTSASSIYAKLGNGDLLVANDALAAASVQVAAATSTDSSTPTTAAVSDDTPSTDLDLQQFYDSGLLTEEALQRLQQEDPDTLRAAIRNLQQQDPDTLEKLLSDVPLTLDNVSELLDAAAAALTANLASPSPVNSDSAPTTGSDSTPAVSTDSVSTAGSDSTPPATGSDATQSSS